LGYAPNTALQHRCQSLANGARNYTARAMCSIKRGMDRDLPVSLGQPVTEYLQELRDRLAATNEYADEHLAHEQKRWVNR